MSGKKLGRKAVRSHKEPAERRHGSFEEQMEEVQRKRQLGRVVQEGIEHGINVEKVLEASLNNNDPLFHSPFTPRKLNTRTRSWYKGSTEESSSSANPIHQPVNSTKESVMTDKSTTSAEEAASSARTKADAYEQGREQGREEAFRAAAQEMRDSAKGFWAKTKDHVSRHRGVYSFLLGAGATVAAQAGVATIAKRSGYRAELRDPQGNVIGDTMVTEPQGGGNQGGGRGR